ncbi:hypothetical protein [Microbacterium invictum]|uniref:Uncharacterized protein n=1 Tax=Microbacterium invictum TaxID=515415 RepID=A0ABZ0V990_9MICO|nr:hypothetical protein [Microbacterium invictum]WQB69804.1 hypothetical protein T9R20_14040 [Microbacterium invictum]
MERFAKTVTFLWLFHAYDSSHDALLGGYAGTGAALIDARHVVVCLNPAGSLYSSTKALKHLTVAHTAHEVELRRMGETIE